MTSLNPCPLVSLKTKGLFTCREEDPRRQNNLMLGFTCGNFGLCGAQVGKVREGIKNDGRPKQKCNFVPSALFPSVNKSF